MSLTLYTYPDNHRAFKALIAAEYNGVKINVPAFEFGKTNRSEHFLTFVNPLGKVPALETPEGGIFESNAIARYVARLRQDTGLYGSTFFQSGQIDSWIDFATNEIDPARGVWLYPILGYLQYNEKAYAEAKADIQKAMKTLDAHLLVNTYLVGNQVTLADIVVSMALFNLFKMVFTPEFLKPFQNVVRWFTTLVNQPEFVKVLGKVEFAKKEQTYGAKEEKAAEPKAEKKAEPKAEKKAEPKAEKKAEPKKEEKPAAAKSELDLLPETTMVLDTTKKLAFSERPFKADFFEQLLNGIWDETGYSFWLCNYKYDDENKVLFMTSNLVSGFLQRCDAVRKYSMGVMNIYGNADEETPPFRVSGAWMFRGLEVPKVEMLSENPDSEYYEWVKIDIKSAEGLAQLKEQFLGETIKGQPCLERKYFK